MIIVSGPSTIGKNPFIYHVCSLYGFRYVVPYTTRTIRKEERDGKDYHFLSKNSFQSMILDGRMTEWDYSLNNYYGYDFAFPGLKNNITHGLSRMAIRIKNRYPNDITTVFFKPYDVSNVERVVRNIYTGDALFYRLALIKEELTHSAMFDYVFKVNLSAEELLKNDAMISLLKMSFDCSHL